jgi:hypothetical protein
MSGAPILSVSANGRSPTTVVVVLNRLRSVDALLRWDEETSFDSG